MAAAILGDTDEVSAFLAGTADFSVVVRGARLSLSGTGAEAADPVKAGIADAVVDTTDEAVAALQRFVALVPTNAWTARPARRAQRRRPRDPDPRARGDWCRAVAPAPTTCAPCSPDSSIPPPGAPDDAPGELLELRPTIGRGLVTALARIDGWPVGIFASNPMFQAGAMDPAACDKGVRLLTLCDSYQIPAIFLQDVAGFLVGRQVEHGRMLFRAVRFLNAIYASSCPTLTVIVRKAFGLAYESMNGRKYHTDGLYAWAGAEIGFMDPEIGVNVLYGDRKTVEEKRAMVADLREGTSPFDAAGVMNIDEVIEPATTATGARPRARRCSPTAGCRPSTNARCDCGRPTDLPRAWRPPGRRRLDPRERHHDHHPFGDPGHRLAGERRRRRRRPSRRRDHHPRVDEDGDPRRRPGERQGHHRARRARTTASKRAMRSPSWTDRR